MRSRCRLCGGETSLLGDRGDVALRRCSVCRLVGGFPAESRPAEAIYASYHTGPPPPDPVVRYEEWLALAERRVGRSRLLEIGAGRGGFVRVAHDRGWDVTATELSLRGIQALRELGIAAVEGDVRAARFADGQFDLVVSLEVLEHLPDPGEHLAELRRITRPGGLLLLSTPSFSGLSRRWLGLSWRVIAPEHLSYFEPSTLSHALRRAGYAAIHLRSRSLDITTWRRPRAGPSPGTFDPERSARLRDALQQRWSLRTVKNGINGVLGLLGLGDSLLAWAERPH